MTDCAEIRTLLVRAVDDTLDAAGREMLSAHVVSCESCRRTLAAQRAVRQALAELPMASVTADFAARVRERVSARWVDVFDFRVWTLRLAPVAALLALLAVLPARGASTASDGTSETASALLDSWRASQLGTSATGTESGASHMQLLLNPDADPHALLAAALEETTR
jgi:anti-sigma factor RsiW